MARTSLNASGIVVDAETQQRVIPESRRADGSIRKERRVKPGFTPNEDIARFRPSRLQREDELRKAGSSSGSIIGSASWAVSQLPRGSSSSSGGAGDAARPDSKPSSASEAAATLPPRRQAPASNTFGTRALSRALGDIGTKPQDQRQQRQPSRGGADSDNWRKGSSSSNSTAGSAPASGRESSKRYNGSSSGSRSDGRAPLKRSATPDDWESSSGTDTKDIADARQSGPAQKTANDDAAQRHQAETEGGSKSGGRTNEAKDDKQRPKQGSDDALDELADGLKSLDVKSHDTRDVAR
ncbi:unnamed protein product [Jaminaea pallidilutea]